MPIESKSALAFGPSFVFSSMLSRVANRLSHTFFVICMTSRLFDTPRMFQYGKSQKIDLVFHTFSSGSGAFRLELIFPGGGHFFQFFNIMSISVSTWGLSYFGCSIEQILAFSPWFIVRKPS